MTPNEWVRSLHARCQHGHELRQCRPCLAAYFSQALADERRACLQAVRDSGIMVDRSGDPSAEVTLQAAIEAIRAREKGTLLPTPRKEPT